MLRICLALCLGAVCIGCPELPTYKGCQNNEDCQRPLPKGVCRSNGSPVPFQFAIVPVYRERGVKSGSKSSPKRVPEKGAPKRVPTRLVKML